MTDQLITDDDYQVADATSTSVWDRRYPTCGMRNCDEYATEQNLCGRHYAEYRAMRDGRS